MPNNDSHQHVVKTSAQWNDRAVEYWVVPRGCLCVELTSRGKTKLKVGEGNKYYAQLPYICDIEDLSDYYTKEEINNLFNNLNRMAIMSTEEYDEKSDLPLTGNKLGDVRFVKSSSPSLKIDPDVYLWNGHKWIFVGYDIIDIDLSQYIKREEFEPVAAKVDEMYPKMHTHENKETLDRIEEPYTTAEKDKLDSLENYDDTEIRALIRQATHVHPNKSILDQIQQPFKNEDKTKLDSLENYDDTELRDRISDVEAVAHTHSNKDELDSIYSGFVDEHQTLVEFKTTAEEEIDDLNNDVADLKTKIHTHSNKNILDSTTAPYTTQDKATLDELAAITIFDGAGPTYDGFRGYVPAPLAGQESYFLRGDGTWAMIESDIEYKAGAGISITDAGPINTDYYFDTQVSCNLSGNRLTMTYTKYNTEPALGAIVSVYTNESFTGPVFVGRTPDSVKYTSNTGDPQGTVVYRDETWYYSTFNGWVDGERVDTLNNMQKIEGLFNFPAQTEDIVFAILDAAHGSPSVAEKEISVVPATTETIGGVIVGGGLEIDEDGVLSAPGGRTYVAGDGVVISDNTSFELSEDTVTNTVYFFDTQVTSRISGRTYTKYNTEPALGAVVYASSYTQPFFVGLTADSVKYGTDYDSHIWPNPDHPSFEYKGVTWYYSGFEYAMSGDGTDASGHMQKLSGIYSVLTEADLQNIARAIIDAADIIPSGTKVISTKIGVGLTFDSNDAIELDDSIKLRLNCNNEPN